MIEKERLLHVKRIVTHANCGDGMASAMILRDAFNYLPTVEFIRHDTPEHREMEVTEGMLFCDFSPHPNLVERCVEAEAIVLDHHKTARHVVDQFVMRGLGVFGDEDTKPGVCGATLAYQHVWVRVAEGRQYPRLNIWVEEFAKLAGIYDTWQKDSVLWYEAVAQQEALKFWNPRDLLDARPNTWTKYLDVGPGLVERKDRAVAEAIKSSLESFVCGPRGVRVQMFQGLSETSLAAEVLGDKVDLVVGFSYMVEAGEEKIIFSLRSHTGFDCGTFCKDHGGGGHTAAAGFSTAVRGDPYSQFLSTLSEWQDRQCRPRMWSPPYPSSPE